MAIKKKKETWKLNVMCDPRLNPRPEFFFFCHKDIYGTIDKSQIRSVDQSIISVLISWFWLLCC